MRRRKSQVCLSRHFALRYSFVYATDRVGAGESGFITCNPWQYGSPRWTISHDGGGKKPGNSRGKRPKKLCTWKEVMGENSQNLNINSLNKTSNEGKYIDFIRYLNASPVLHSRLQRKWDKDTQFVIELENTEYVLTVHAHRNYSRWRRARRGKCR